MVMDAETMEGLQVLKSLKLVMFGGSACPDELRDLLVNEGVRVLVSEIDNLLPMQLKWVSS
jgi:hypothetical protein